MKQLGVLGKYWEPGAVKTRLAQSIGKETAANIYKAFLETTLGRCGAVDADHTLAFWPPDREREMASLAGDDWHLLPQSDGNLGERMRDFFERALQQPETRVVLIGSDSPHLPLGYIEEAFERLRDVPVVMGPSDDGGYYLVGATRLVPEMFTDIDWSSQDVWQQTEAKLKATGTRFDQLPTWYDVDEEADLKRLLKDLAETKREDPHLAALAATLADIARSTFISGKPLDWYAL